MQSSTGQYSTQAGEPAHPVQHSVMTANSFGFFFRGVARPLDSGSNFWSSGTIPTALVAPGAGGMKGIISQKAGSSQLQLSAFRSQLLDAAQRGNPESCRSLGRV